MEHIRRRCVSSRGFNPLRHTLLYNQTYATLKEAKVVLVASGTATLEAAILNTPMVVGYKGQSHLLLDRQTAR